ncbi:PLC-like phosphodiesterase [Wolfiporia cocos MD-104 SS10]|uniref:PLC-like phosphodiesterase n=1 Tax=Wolfiporia cocos (strain MD-104) TaxID=742152 RepID=A0A2H3JRX0_WOLCO|nr:PLC-like phosphodiesterase [Wolfiporia cocos MD-104 SS10]
MLSSKPLPECWGHRGASAAFPENTLVSFEKAIRDGCECIESDVHVSLDNVILMFHDPSLDRTTNGKGLLREHYWYGPDGMEHLRTIKEPKQSIPTFPELIALIMKPENRHVKLNVDVKVYNDPDRIFSLMRDIISVQPDWEEALAPRIILGLWHSKFIAPAQTMLPYCRLIHIGFSINIARTYFWESCSGFSIFFSTLASAHGEKFRKDCKAAGKDLIVWTVNKPEYMAEAVRWEADAIITDVPHTWIQLRNSLKADRKKTLSQHGRSFLWTTWRLYFPVVRFWEIIAWYWLKRLGGPMQKYSLIATKKTE